MGVTDGYEVQKTFLSLPPKPKVVQHVSRINHLTYDSTTNFLHIHYLTQNVAIKEFIIKFLEIINSARIIATLILRQD